MVLSCCHVAIPVADLAALTDRSEQRPGGVRLHRAPSLHRGAGAADRVLIASLSRIADSSAEFLDCCRNDFLRYSADRLDYEAGIQRHDAIGPIQLGTGSAPLSKSADVSGTPRSACGREVTGRAIKSPYSSSAVRASTGRRLVA